MKWKSFDGLEISGFLYQPPAKFTGKRPVIINIHGGPEAQYQPGFIGRNIMAALASAPKRSPTRRVSQRIASGRRPYVQGSGVGRSALASRMSPAPSRIAPVARTPSANGAGRGASAAVFNV